MGKSFKAIYANGNIFDGTIHPQVDSGLGFSCDEKILPLVKLLNNDHVITRSSCQNLYEDTTCRDKKARIMLVTVSKDPAILFKYCLFLLKSLSKTNHRYQCCLSVDNQYPVVCADITFPPSMISRLTKYLTSNFFDPNSMQ